MEITIIQKDGKKFIYNEEEINESLHMEVSDVAVIIYIGYRSSLFFYWKDIEEINIR